MTTWQQACSSARETMTTMAMKLLYETCDELFEICHRLGTLTEEAEEKYSSTVFCGLCAANYRLAGTVKNIATASNLVLSVIDEQNGIRSGGETATNLIKFPLMASADTCPIGKLEDYQKALSNFAEALKNDCYRELMHLTSEIKVMLEHPLVVADASFERLLQAQHDAIESYSERIYEMGEQLEADPVLKIDTTIVDSNMH